MDAAQLAKIAKALADPTRLQIYQTIAAQPDLFCGEILQQYKLAPGTLSHHLKTLVGAGLIECRREGQFIHSRVIPETIRGYTDALTRVSQPSAKKKRP